MPIEITARRTLCKLDLYIEAEVNNCNKYTIYILSFDCLSQSTMFNNI